MKIFFENYRYPKDLMTKCFEGPGQEKILEPADRDGYTMTKSIGYLFVKNDRYDGPVFILPKTFLTEDINGKLTVFGLPGALPEKCIDVDSTENPMYRSNYDSFLP